MGGGRQRVHGDMVIIDKPKPDCRLNLAAGSFQFGQLHETGLMHLSIGKTGARTSKLSPRER